MDVTIGSLTVPRGDYALHLLYSKAGWQLIVNTASASWGSEYAKREVGRTALTSRARAEPEESLSVYLPESARPGSGRAELRGRLRIVWRSTELTAPWSVAR